MHKGFTEMDISELYLQSIHTLTVIRAIH